MMGDKNNSIVAEIEERMDNIWIAFACGDECDDDEVVVNDSDRWRVNDGNGEKITMDVDATIKKDV